MQYDEIVAQVRQRSGLDPEHAERALIAVVEVLGERLAGQEPSHLASQLPNEIQHPLTQQTGQADPFDLSEFQRRVAEREGAGCTAEQGGEHARAVFGALDAAVTAGEFNDMIAQLPKEYGRLLS